MSVFYYMRELFSILSPTNLTLFFLCFHRKTDYIFDHVANGLSVVCEMLTDGNDCFTNNQIIHSILCEINRSIFKCRLRFFPFIIKSVVTFFDDFWWWIENRIEAAAPYIQFIIAVFIVDFFISNFVVHSFPPSCVVCLLPPNSGRSKTKKLPHRASRNKHKNTCTYLMVLCNSQREEGLVPSQICRTSNRVIPQNYKINLEPIFNFLRLFYWIIVEKTSMSRSAEKTFFTSAQVAQKLFFIMLLLDKLARRCTLGNAQNERAAIIER